MRKNEPVLQIKTPKKSLCYRIKAMIYRPGMRYWKRHLMYFLGFHDEAKRLVERLRAISQMAGNGELRSLLITHLDHFEAKAEAERQLFDLDKVWMAHDLDALTSEPDPKIEFRRLIQELTKFLDESHGMSPSSVRRNLKAMIEYYGEHAGMERTDDLQ